MTKTYQAASEPHIKTMLLCAPRIIRLCVVATGIVLVDKMINWYMNKYL